MVPEMHAFDEVTKGVAAGTISRRKALALAGGAALSAALVPFAAPAEAGRRRRNRCKGKPAITNDRCPMITKDDLCKLTQNESCQCARRVPDGRKVCVNLSGENCPATDECDNSRDCPGSRVCIQVGGCCKRRRNLCARNCPRN